MTLPCQHCGSNATQPFPWHYLLDVVGHRVHRVYCWRFCSPACRETWLEAPASPEELGRSGTQEEWERADDKRDLAFLDGERLVAYAYTTEPVHGALDAEVSLAVFGVADWIGWHNAPAVRVGRYVFDDGRELDRWWRDAALVGRAAPPPPCAPEHGPGIEFVADLIPEVARSAA